MRYPRLALRCRSKSKSALRCISLATAATVSCLSGSRGASAAIYSWYAGGSTGSVGGTGNWDSTDPFWTANGTNFVTWTPGSVAAFGGTAGTVTLTTNETAGGLTFGLGGYTIASGGGTLTLTTGSVITTTGGTDSITTAIGGAAGVAVTKTGSGTLALSTSNSGLGTAASPAVWTVTGGNYSAGTGIFDSVLSIGAGNNLGATPTVATTQLILNAGTLKITGTGLNPAIGSGRIIQVSAGGGSIVDSNGNPFQGAIVDNAGSATSLYLSNASGTTSFQGAVTGTGGLTWNGAGILALSASNSYQGGTTINGGSISFSTDANLGAAGSTISLNGGTLQSNSSISSFSHVIATGTAGGTINTASGTSLQIGNFGGNSASITGSGGITVNGAQLTLSANDSGYSGNWTVNSGVLEAQYNGTVSLGSGGVTLASGAELADDYAKNVNNAITSNGGILSFDNGGGGTYSGSISLASGMTTVGLRDFYSTSTATSGTISGLISGSGSLSTTGGGVLTLSNAANAFTGGITINTGTSLDLNADGDLGPTGTTVSFAGGTLASVQTASISLTHLLNTGIGGTIQLNNGTITSGNSKLLVPNAQQIIGSGPITVTNNGVLSIDASNSGFTGNWILNGGVTELTSGTAAGTGSITINSGAELTTLGSQIANPLSINGGMIGWDFYSGSGLYSGAVNLAGTATVGLSNYYGAGSISGTISGNITGAGGLTTSNGGTASYGGGLTLTGTGNTYSGGTTISPGTYLHLGTGSSIGTSNGSLSVAGTFDPNGNNVSVSSLASQGGNFYFNLNSSGVPNQISVGSGGATLSGITGFEINTASASTISLGTYTLVSSTGTGLNGSVSFAGGQVLTVPATTSIQSIGGTNYKLTLASSASAVTVNVAAAPSKTINIMPLGSSITAGQSAQDPYNGGGYRSQLYQSLVDDGRFTPQFVGSSTATLANDGTSTDLMSAVGQTHHEGHPGYTTSQTLNNLNANDGSGGNDGGYWLKPGNGVNPDYITLNIGGNDFVPGSQDGSYTNSAAIGTLSSILTSISTLRPNATVIVSNIMYRGDNSGQVAGTSGGTSGFLNLYNPFIPSLVYAHTLLGQHVEFLDLYDLITPNNSLALIGPDMVHPIQAGYDMIGNAWYTSITTGQAFFSGTQGSTLNATSGSSTNWTMDYAGTTDLGQQPSTGTDVYFNGGGSGTLNLGQNYSVRSVNFTAGQTASVNLTGNTLTIGSGGITVQSGTAAHTISSGVSLGAAQYWSSIASSPFTVAGSIGGSGTLSIGATGSLSVASTGRFIFSGANSYSGGTTINGGTLEVDNATGSGAGSGGVAVMTGAALSGSGSVSGNVEVKSGGFLSPGTSASTAVLTLSNLTLESGSTLSLQLGNPAASSYIQTSGSAVTFAGATLSLQLLDSFVGTAGTTYNVIENNASGTFSTQFAGLPATGSTIQAGGTTFSINYTGGDGNDITLSVVPEPSSIGLAIGAMGMTVLKRRRRNG